MILPQLHNLVIREVKEVLAALKHIPIQFLFLKEFSQIMLRMTWEKLLKFSWNIAMEQVTKEIVLPLSIIKMRNYISEELILLRLNLLIYRKHWDFSQKLLTSLSQEDQQEDLLPFFGLTMSEKKQKLKMFMPFLIQEYSWTLPVYQIINILIVNHLLIFWNYQM